MSGFAQVAHAQGLTIDVVGVPGSNESTWTFSGSYAVVDVEQVDNFYSYDGVCGPPFVTCMAEGDINSFTHDSGNLTDGIGWDAAAQPSTFNLQFFQFLSSTAQVSGSQSGTHLLDAIFLDSDDPTTGDDFAWYAPGDLSRWRDVDVQWDSKDRLRHDGDDFR